MDFLKKIVKSSIEATTRMSDDTPVLDFGLVPGKRLGLPGSPVSVDYDPAQKLLLVSLHNGDLFLSNADTQIILPKPKDASLHSVKSSILTCIIGTPFVWVRDEHTLRIWDLIRKTSTQIQTINASDITAVQSLPGSGIVFVGFKSGSVLSLDASNGVESSVIEPLEQSQVIGLAPCPVDASLLLISYDTTVHLYDTKECKSVKTFTVDSFNGLQPGSIAWRPDGHHVCVTFNDTLAVWSVKENWLVKKQKPVAVRSLAAPLSKSHPDLVASGNGPITKTVWLPGPTNGQNDSWIVCAGGSKEPGITVLHFDAHPKDYKSPSHSSFFPTTSKLETVVYHDGALLFLLLSDTQGVEAKLFRETWIDIELPSCAAFAARAPKSTLKVFGNGNDVTLLDMCESSKEERKMGRQKPSLPLALNPYHAKDLVRSWDIMCLNFGKGELELWDVSGQRRLFTVNVDSYFTHTPIEHIHLDLADRTLVILGGPHLVLYRFFTTTDIQRVKNEQKEFESMIAGLDEVVESALKEADFVTGILKAKTGGADFEESEAVVVDSPHEQPVDSPLKSPVQSATTELPSPTSVISNDGWLTEFPSSEMQSSGWGLSVHLAHTSALLTVVTDVRHDLMVLVSDSLCLDVTRLSSCQLLKRCSLEEPLVLGTLAHPKIVKFVRTHFVNDHVASMCLIVATSRGSLILVNLGTLDELESADFKLDQSRCLYKPIQKTETPVMVKVLDDDGNPHRTGRLPPANEHYIVYVVATGIKIILVSKRAPSEVLKEKELKYKDGLILQSEIFTVGETPFLACITSIGSIRVYSLPDVKHQSTTTMPLESFDANTLMNSFVSSSGFLTLWSQPGELQTYRIAQKSQTVSIETSTDRMYDSFVAKNWVKEVRSRIKNLDEMKKGLDCSRSRMQSSKDSYLEASTGRQNEMLEKMNERGEALEKLESKFADLSAGTGSFLEKVKELNEKEKAKKWWQI